MVTVLVPTGEQNYFYFLSKLCLKLVVIVSFFFTFELTETGS